MSRKLDLTDDDLYEEFGDEELTEERGPSSVAFRILAVFFFLIAVAGLFIGMIPALDSSIATGEGVWSGSMLATVIEAFKKLFKMDYIVPDYGLDNAVSIAIPYQFGVQRIAKYLPCVVLGGIGISLIAAIVALASGKAAKVSAYIGGIAVFITYGFAFAYLFAARTYLLSATALLDAVDIPLGIIVAVTFLVLLIASIGLRKGYGLANGIVVALAMAGIVAFVYPDVVTLERLRSVFSSIKDAPIADVIILFGMSAILVFNLIVSTFRFAAKRGYPFDAVRHFAMFGFAVATACLFVFADGFASPDWEALASLPMILLLASSLAAFLVSLLCAIAVAVQKSRAEEDADDEEEEDNDDDTSEEAEGEDNKDDKLVRFTIILSLFLIVSFGISLFGYPYLSAFILNRFITSVILIGILIALRKVFYDAIHRLLLLRLWVKTFRLRRRLIRKLDFWSGIIIDPLFVLMGCFAILSLWGVPTDMLSNLIVRLFTGFKIGGVEISLIAIILGIIAYFLVIALFRGIRRRLQDNVFSKMDMDDGIKHSLIAGISFIGYVTAILAAVLIMGADLSNLALVAGALSVGIGLGLQNLQTIFNNFVS